MLPWSKIGRKIPQKAKLAYRGYELWQSCQAVTMATPYYYPHPQDSAHGSPNIVSQFQEVLTEEEAF